MMDSIYVCSWEAWLKKTTLRFQIQTQQNRGEHLHGKPADLPKFNPQSQTTKLGRNLLRYKMRGVSHRRLIHHCRTPAALESTALTMTFPTQQLLSQGICCMPIE